MSNIARILSQLACLKQFKVYSKSETDIRGWVANQSYFIDYDIEPNCFKVRINDHSFFLALANDCDRMARAAFETITNIQSNPTFPKSSSWHFIQSYYSAFFSAHAILRVFGISCNQFDQEHMNKILEQVELFDRANGVSRLEKGFYKLQFNDSTNEIEFKKLKDSHRDTWACFLTLIKELIQKIDQTTGLGDEKIKAINLLSEIKDGLTRSGGSSTGNWLSIIRNDVNYRHSHGLWFPFRRQNLGQYNKENCCTDWLNDSINTFTLTGRKDIEAALILNTLIINLLKNLLWECNERFLNENKIFKNGSLKMLEIIGAH
ncbi:hypothetical protein [Candidatus Nitrospira allomarina]|uniref:Uncharacterized protein n=1 Tax=Candidatus Nitrospira allomarina TaxID=3020900 RepID=A0AA96JQJ4_9BACT|nr:hypothetical protein [Candidatus Nitrospira allomarina]WNM56517.1 hypothetical protein PP769_11040 [Candidatus Nitrospira allomarina]